MINPRYQTKIAVRTRLELATPCVTGRYSNQLNYRTVLFECSAKVNNSSLPANNYAIFSHQGLKNENCTLP